MTKRKLTITYTVTESVEVDIEDYALTQKEIEAIEAKNTSVIVPDIADDWDAKWDSTPKTIEESPIAPEEFWYESESFIFATNGFSMVLRESPIQVLGERWLSLSEVAIGNATQVLRMDFSSFGPHPGYFPKDLIERFLGLDGVKIVGESSISPGYVTVNGKLIAVVMPTLARQTNKNMKLSS